MTIETSLCYYTQHYGITCCASVLFTSLDIFISSQKWIDPVWSDGLLYLFSEVILSFVNVKNRNRIKKKTLFFFNIKFS